MRARAAQWFPVYIAVFRYKRFLTPRRLIRALGYVIRLPPETALRNTLPIRLADLTTSPSSSLPASLLILIPRGRQGAALGYTIRNTFTSYTAGPCISAERIDSVIRLRSAPATLAIPRASCPNIIFNSTLCSSTRRIGESRPNRRQPCFRSAFALKSIAGAGARDNLKGGRMSRWPGLARRCANAAGCPAWTDRDRVGFLDARLDLKQLGHHATSVTMPPSIRRTS